METVIQVKKKNFDLVSSSHLQDMTFSDHTWGKKTWAYTKSIQGLLPGIFAKICAQAEELTNTLLKGLLQEGKDALMEEVDNDEWANLVYIPHSGDEDYTFCTACLDVC